MSAADTTVRLSRSAGHDRPAALVREADDAPSWRGYWASPDHAVVTLTVTAAGYQRASEGRLDTDGSQKIPVRIAPTVRAELAQGRVPLGAARVLAAWTLHLRVSALP